MGSQAVISLTTDFGLDDPFVGIMKGVILGRDPGLRIIDLCHGVPQGQVGIAGLWLGLSSRWLPASSVHVAVVDPGVGSDRAILCLQHQNQYFLAPDNGLAAELCRHQEFSGIHRLDFQSARARLGIDPPCNTFHGRDVFAPVAADLARGIITPEQLGPACDGCEIPSPLPLPLLQQRSVEGQILLKDHFGNLMSNITAAQIPEGSRPRIRLDTRSFGLARTYAEADSGAIVGVLNSFDLLEIACVDGNAGEILGLGPGTPIRVEFM
ncbi:MAG: SAM-dependent chlorinase/fluorinase [Gammaproteobacteria bacterium]